MGPGGLALECTPVKYGEARRGADRESPPEAAARGGGAGAQRRPLPRRGAVRRRAAPGGAALGGGRNTVQYGEARRGAGTESPPEAAARGRRGRSAATALAPTRSRPPTGRSGRSGPWRRLSTTGVADGTGGVVWVACEHGDPFARAAALPLGVEAVRDFPHEPLGEDPGLRAQVVLDASLLRAPAPGPGQVGARATRARLRGSHRRGRSRLARRRPRAGRRRAPPRPRGARPRPGAPPRRSRPHPRRPGDPRRLLGLVGRHHRPGRHRRRDRHRRLGQPGLDPAVPPARPGLARAAPPRGERGHRPHHDRLDRSRARGLRPRARRARHPGAGGRRSGDGGGRRVDRLAGLRAGRRRDASRRRRAAAGPARAVRRARGHRHAHRGRARTAAPRARPDHRRTDRGRGRARAVRSGHDDPTSAPSRRGRGAARDCRSRRPRGRHRVRDATGGRRGHPGPAPAAQGRRRPQRAGRPRGAPGRGSRTPCRR